jgi:diguanylate cyclase (GGDEF)-like protein
MRIKTITNWAYGATLLLTGLSGTAFILSSISAAKERVTLEQHLYLDDLGEQLALAAERRSDEARLFVMRGAPRHLDAFRQEERLVNGREKLIARLGRHGLPRVEQAALETARANLDELDRIERMAIRLMRGGDTARAQAMLFGPDHERAQTAVLEPIKRFRDLVGSRTNADIRDAQATSDLFSNIAKVMLALTALLFLAVLYFILRRRVVLPLDRMTGIVSRLARQDFTVDVPKLSRSDEIGDMNNAIGVFRSNGLERDRLESERMAEQRIKDSILRMMHRLQAASTQQELAEVVACFVPQTFPNVAGQLYVLDRTGATLGLVGSWLEPANICQTFPPGACWGVRRGRPHVSNQNHNDIPCAHVDGAIAPSLCVPLTALGDTIGLLYLEEGPQAELGEHTRLYVELMAENIGLALANLRLREQLMGLALRDGLTGLFNRRCLDEALNRYARDTHEGSVGCLMIDIDHFKRFNDEFGHDSGDFVMQHVAAILQEATQEVGNAYRFGGEEFTVVAPGLDEDAACLLAERIRERIQAAPLAHRGRPLGTLTVSIGVAAAPQSGPVSTLLGSADAALLEAKARGRNQVLSSRMLAQLAPENAAV